MKGPGDYKINALLWKQQCNPLVQSVIYDRKLELELKVGGKRLALRGTVCCLNVAFVAMPLSKPLKH